ncbi:MAG: hypothetical protein JWQ07_341 [Ramlibacter sp.]|nr:hypothetical protein [Ramlibacter sp.]
MSTERTIYRIEAAPGDAPRAVEQPNGDLLVPADVRPLIAQALLQAELALAKDQQVDLPSLKQARRLLGIEQPDTRRQWLANLYRVRPI